MKPNDIIVVVPNNLNNVRYYGVINSITKNGIKTKQYWSIISGRRFGPLTGGLFPFEHYKSFKVVKRVPNR